jgi:hypothetical protein
MSDNHGASCDQDTRLENFAARLTIAAYHVALRHGAAEVWIAVELGLWRALSGTVKKWARERPPPASSDEFEVWRQGFLVDLTADARRIVQENVVEGFPLEVESDLYRAFRLVIGRRDGIK